MVANLGYGALVITFFISFYGIAAAIYGVRKNEPKWVDSARNAMLLTWPLITLSAFSIIYLLVSGHYEVEYVAQVTSNSMPLYLKITALWGGQAGSLVFWSWLMSAFASAVTLRKWERDREFLPWVIVVSLVTLAFFLSLVIFFENPFKQLWQFPGQGQPFSAMFPPAGAIPIYPSGWKRAEPAAAPPGYDHSPADALPWLCLVCDPLRLRHRCPGHRPHGRPLDPPDPPLDTGGLVVPLVGSGPGKPLGVRCARLGRVTGVGTR